MVQAHGKRCAHILIPGGCLVEVWIGALASFGVFCVLWTVFGWLLSGGRGTVVCLGEPAGAVLLARRLRLLRELGLFRGRSFRWGYFPEVLPYDPDALIAAKQPIPAAVRLSNLHAAPGLNQQKSTA